MERTGAPETPPAVHLTAPRQRTEAPTEWSHRPGRIPAGSVSRRVPFSHRRGREGNRRGLPRSGTRAPAPGPIPRRGFPSTGPPGGRRPPLPTATSPFPRPLSSFPRPPVREGLEANAFFATLPSSLIPTSISGGALRHGGQRFFRLLYLSSGYRAEKERAWPRPKTTSRADWAARAGENVSASLCGGKKRKVGNLEENKGPARGEPPTRSRRLEPPPFPNHGCLRGKSARNVVKRVGGLRRRGCPTAIALRPPRTAHRRSPGHLDPPGVDRLESPGNARPTLPCRRCTWIME